MSNITLKYKVATNVIQQLYDRNPDFNFYYLKDLINNRKVINRFSNEEREKMKEHLIHYLERTGHPNPVMELPDTLRF